MLSRSLRLAEPEGYVRLFVDYGEPMARLLRAVAARSSTSAYAQAILAAMGEHPASIAQTLEHAILSDPLSEQELRMSI